MNKVWQNASADVQKDLRYLLYNWLLGLISVFSFAFLCTNVINQRPMINVLTPVIIMILSGLLLLMSKIFGRYHLSRISFMAAITFLYVPVGYYTSPGSESAILYIILMTIVLQSFIAVRVWEYVFPVLTFLESLLLLQTEIIFPDHYYVYTNQKYRIFDITVNYTVVAIALIITVSYVMSKYNAYSADMARVSMLDSLTGIYNRRYFVEFIHHQIDDVKEKKQDFSMILLDLDHFKNVNDEYGHLTGDQVLVHTTSLIRKNIRRSDVICRWGGEEFVIFLMDTNLEDASLIAEKLREQIEITPVDQMIHLTASFGVSQFVPEDDSVSIFRRLDNSLYLAKLTGRNKVVSNEKIYIQKSGMPANIEWGPFFRSGHPLIDQEHSELIALCNELSIQCFKDDNEVALDAYLNNMVSHIIQHFENEEEILKELSFEDLEEHIKVHAAMTAKTRELVERHKEGTIDKTELARHIIQDVVIGHIVQNDFKFFDQLQKEANSSLKR